MSIVIPTRESTCRVTVKDLPNTIVVRPVGQVDLDSAPSLARTVAECLARSSSVVIDASGVDFIDCAGLHALFPAWRIGPDPVLMLPSACVCRLLDLLGLDVKVVEDVWFGAGE